MSNAPLSRRAFLHMVGAFGGSTAVYRAAVGLGLLPVGAHTTRPDIAALRARDRKSVLILGAGLSGLAAAYELDRKGYDVAEKFAQLPPVERTRLAIQQGEKIHPGYGRYVENSISIAWHRMNHMFGCPVRWSDSLQARWFKALQAPVGGHYLIGDQMSYHPGWQEGALHSAFHAIADIDQRVRERAA